MRPVANTLKKIKIIDKPLAKLIKRKILVKLLKQDMERGDFTKIPRNSMS